jgi:hypothetical protein
VWLRPCGGWKERSLTMWRSPQAWRWDWPMACTLREGSVTPNGSLPTSMSSTCTVPGTTPPQPEKNLKKGLDMIDCLYYIVVAVVTAPLLVTFLIHYRHEDC